MSAGILESEMTDILPLTSLGKLFFTTLKKRDPKQNIFIDSTGEDITYEKILKTSVRLAIKFQDLGLKNGDFIAIITQNSWKYVVTILASLYLGITTINLNPEYTPGEFQHLLTHSKPRVIFCTSTALNIIQILKTDEIIITYDKNETLVDFDECIKSVEYDDTFMPVELNPTKDVAFILMSSGTTGLPKGVQITHQNFLITLSYSGDPAVFNITEKDSSITFLPFFHIFGLGLSMACLFYGAKFIILDKFIPDSFLSLIQKHKVNKLWIVPPILLFLLKSPKVLNYDISSIKDIFCGGAPLKREAEDMATKQLKLKNVRQIYGLTETCGAAMVHPGGATKAGSCGKLVATFSAKICNPETGKILGPNESGEIRLKGVALMKGYLGNDQQTRESIDEDGFLRTGDLGYYDDDNYFYITDRLKELIKYKGFQVAPAELENLLLQHPSVKDVAVCGKPDERAGEVSLAFIVKQPDCTVTEEELIKHVADNISVQKHLYGGVKFLEEIPKGPSGKILRRKLKELL